MFQYSVERAKADWCNVRAKAAYVTNILEFGAGKVRMGAVLD